MGDSIPLSNMEVVDPPELNMGVNCQNANWISIFRMSGRKMKSQWRHKNFTHKKSNLHHSDVTIICFANVGFVIITPFCLQTLSKVCSINLERTDDNDLCSACHVYPLSLRARIISILFILNRLSWGLNYLIWWISQTLWLSELKHFSYHCKRE